MDEKLVQQIRKNIEPKETEELINIWEENDREAYSEEAFEAIKQVLLERVSELPSQKIVQESSKDIPFPQVGNGYIFGILLFLLFTAKFPIAVKTSSFLVILIGLTICIAIATIFYWFFCIHRIHKILKKMSNDFYPITPWRVVLYHFIPIYNLYWIVKWPKEITIFVNNKWNGLTQYIGTYAVELKKRSKHSIGILFLLTFVFDIYLSITLDVPKSYIASIFLLFIYYGALHILVSRVKEAFIIDKLVKSFNNAR